MRAKTVGDVGERGIIALIRAAFPARGRNVLLGIGDDSAVVRPGRVPAILTKDLLVENVDFYRNRHPAYYVGRKSLAVNLSDIAAMGGTPRYALLGLGWPGDLPLLWARDFLRGFRDAAGDSHTELIGGDISRAREIVISVTAIGEARSIVRRGGAKPGDGIFVSGTLGDAALGLALMERGAVLGRSRVRNAVLKAFLDPQPQICLGRELSRGRIASSMIDLSDGLSVDLRHICEESGTGAEIDLQAIPLSAGMRTYGGDRALDFALHGGEDFQLLFTVPPERAKADLLKAAAGRFPLTYIGRIRERKGVFGIDAAGRRAPIAARGYEHFKA